MEKYFSRAEVHYHLTTIKQHHKVKNKMQEYSVVKAITAINANADVIDFFILSEETNGFGVNRVVFTKLADNTYTPHRLAYQMVLDREPVSVESFEQKLAQIKIDWDTYHTTPGVMPLI